MRKFPITITLTSFLALNCGAPITTIDQKQTDKLYIVNPTLQDHSSRKRILLDNFGRADLDNLPQDLPGYYKSAFVAGGWGERRYFYGATPTSEVLSFHLGIDAMFDVNVPIVAPVAGEVLASYWVKNHNNSFASGIGGVVVMRARIENLALPAALKTMIYVQEGQKIYAYPKFALMSEGNFYEPTDNLGQSLTRTFEEYQTFLNTISTSEAKQIETNKNDVYLAFMHLGQATPSLLEGKTIMFDQLRGSSNYTYFINTSIDSNRPYKVREGQVLGYIGSAEDNGGWSPHVHLSAYAGSNPKNFINRLEKYTLSSLDQTALASALWAFKPTGVLINNTSIKNSNDFAKYAFNSSLIDPNTLYELYNEQTPVVSLGSRTKGI